MRGLLSRCAPTMLVPILLLALVAPTRVQNPIPRSTLVGRFVSHTDPDFGYAMLVPAGWEHIHLGNVAGYMPPDSDGATDRVLLDVRNVNVTSRWLPEGSRVAGLAGFQRSGSLDDWLSSLAKVSGERKG